MTVVQGFLLGLVAGLSPSLIVLCFLAWKISGRSSDRLEQIQEPPANQAQPKCFASEGYKRMTANGIGGPRVASTVIPAAATSSILLAACMSVIAAALPQGTSSRVSPRRRRV
jgi:hypothetical protein